MDAHVHVWPRGLVHPAQAKPTPLAASPADLLAAMDAAGIDVAVVSPAAVHPDNGYVLGAVGAVPGRLIAIVGLDPRDARAAARLAEHARHGAAGVRLSQGPRPFELPRDGPALTDLGQAAAALGLVVQWTIPLPLVELLPFVAARAPGVAQVLDHLGLPPDPSALRELDRIRAVAAAERTYVKLSGLYAFSREAYPFRDTWGWVDGVLDAFGPTRTMWASDWPLATRAASLTAWRALPEQLPMLHQAALPQVLGSTAAALFGLAPAHTR